MEAYKDIGEHQWTNNLNKKDATEKKKNVVQKCKEGLGYKQLSQA